MKHEIIQHELLLFTGNGFSQRQFCPRDENDKSRKLSPMEELEKACWDGILFELFPEIVGNFSIKCESFIWHIMSGKNYLRICLGPTPASIKNETAIDPYFSLLSVSEN
jgi:hypothetical protein